MRAAYYTGASVAAAAACLFKAFSSRPNFYSAVVYLAQSNACVLILTNLLLCMACSFLYGFQRAMYGKLRPIEIEQLSEKAWYAVLDTLLAMPSFRDDVGGWLLTMFVLLLAGKVWSWIGEGRVDVLEQQPPSNPRLFHARLSTSLAVNCAFAVAMLRFCIQCVVADPRPGMMVIFTFEFAVLSVSSIFTMCRYLLTVTEIIVTKRQTKVAIQARKNEIRAEREAERVARGVAVSDEPEEPIEVDENEVDVPGWEDKRRYLFAFEVVTDFIKLVIYVAFFTVSITFNGLPMHIMRDVYMTFSSFSKRVSDYLNYRKATSDMNTKYPDATEEEIRGDACIVCREDMVAWESAQPANGARRDEGLRAKKLPCGHILHLRCLKAWLERQQVCPTCRRPVVATPDAAQPQQNAAPAAAGQQDQQPQQGAGAQAAPRGRRPRFLNLGPIRIGFLNGPAGEVQNVINQIRNPQQQPQAQEQQQQQPHGPNHLGLDVPYLPPTATAGTTQIPSTTAPIHIQIMQLEQRVMQEAQNLGVDEQELMTLRYMEGEMSRLRALRQQLSMQSQQRSAPQQDTVLQGNGQQLAAGHEDLPEGMLLPEGWTVMPLQRAGTPAAPTAVSQQQPNVPTPTQTSTPSAPQQGSNPSSQPPTNGDGEPLFESNNTSPPPPQQQQQQQQQQTTASSPPSEPQQLPPSSSPVPWTSKSHRWGFNTDKSTTKRSSSPATSTHEAYIGKGKARANTVEVEDVELDDE
ncbi:hypothetical protein K431DRAFT_288578 [Polychaeton citri CBS 116435]|uniref:RING-type E3 ubiquitin transferase n=1 Tax=Polychaeton citri CBS 116435 TaxID=1314669 RepID=A0A9P4Q3D1_9PEZI|nr:hypothetical protein K431DRAFT_288578 [Polychaeton citri CBS 116435]